MPRKVPTLIEAKRTLLLIVDMQERLVAAIRDGEAVLDETRRLLAAARRWGIPVVSSVHCPDALGAACEALRGRWESREIMRKTVFSCLGATALRCLRRPPGRLWCAGSKTHVCVLQTVLDLLARRRQVFVVASAVSSQLEIDKTLALKRMAQSGAQIVTFDMVMFEWIRTADHPAFRDVLAMVKDRRARREDGRGSTRICGR